MASPEGASARGSAATSASAGETSSFMASTRKTTAPARRRADRSSAASALSSHSRAAPTGGLACHPGTSAASGLSGRRGTGRRTDHPAPTRRRVNHSASAGRRYDHSAAGCGARWRIEDPSVASRNPGRDKTTCTRRTYAGKSSSVKSRHRVDPENPVSPDVIKMVRDKHGSIVHMHDPVKIIQNEESGKPETVAPEGIGDPGIQVIVVRWRSVVGDHRRPFFVVIIIYHFRIGVVLCTGGFRSVGFIACKGLDADAELSGDVIKPLQGLIPAHR